MVMRWLDVVSWIGVVVVGLVDIDTNVDVVVDSIITVVAVDVVYVADIVDSAYVTDVVDIIDVIYNRG